MAHSAFSQVPVVLSVNNDVSLRKSVFKSNRVSFHEKSWSSSQSLDFRAASFQYRGRPVVCMSVQQASKPFLQFEREEVGKTVVKMNKKEVFKLAKGLRGRARERVEKALQYSYRDRRNKKRDMRSLWIQRNNAATQQHGVNYGNFLHGLMKENIQLNRKVLAAISMYEPYSFKALVDISRTASPGNKAAVAPKKEGLAILL